MSDTYYIQNVIEFFITIYSFVMATWKTKLFFAWAVTGILYWVLPISKTPDYETWKDFFGYVFHTLLFIWVMILFMIGFWQVIK